MSHTLYNDADFTDEELERRNKLAIAVVEGGLSVCKVCGEYEAGLDNPCMSHICIKTLRAIHENTSGLLDNPSIIFLLKNEMIDWDVKKGCGYKVTEQGLKSIND